jgi:hypothetical protein
MNLHFIFVHFPIALMTLYAFLELVSVKKLRNLPYWLYIKATIAITSAVSAVITLQTGDAIEGKFRYVRDLVEVHSSWADASTAIFLVIAAGYAVSWINNEWKVNTVSIRYFSPVWTVATKLSAVILKRPVIFLLALAGLVCISITGALGGAISQGPDIDPIVHFVYHLFFTK